MRFSSVKELELYNSNVSLVKCFKIIVNDKIFGFTDYYENFIYNNITYYSNNIINNKDISNNNFILNKTNLILLYLDEVVLSFVNLTNTNYHNVKIEIFLFDILSKNDIYITSCFVKSINIKDEVCHIYTNSIYSIFDKKITETYSPLCRCDFCDKKCSLNKNDFIDIGYVFDIINNREIITKTENILKKPLNYYCNGFLTFKNIHNNDSLIQVNYFNNGLIQFINKIDFTIYVGDKFEIIAGCNKSFDCCCNKFNNAINFRGEPNLPRTENIYKQF